MISRRMALTGGLAASVAVTGRSRAATPGVTATEIKIGNTMPYSGPASAYSGVGKADVGFFKWVNDQGGVAGHKINFLSYDDGYSPPKTVEQVRRLVEEDKVDFLFHTLGTPTNSAIERYLNQKKVPQLFVATGADKWGNYKEYPVDHRLAAELPDRSADLHQIHAAAEARTPRWASCIRTTISARTTRSASGRARQGLGQARGEVDHL